MVTIKDILLAAVKPYSLNAPSPLERTPGIEYYVTKNDLVREVQNTVKALTRVGLGWAVVLILREYTSVFETISLNEVNPDPLELLTILYYLYIHFDALLSTTSMYATWRHLGKRDMFEDNV